MASKIKHINLIKIIFDIIISALLVLMFNKNVISLNFHEIGGLILLGCFLIHKLLNWKWIVEVSKKIFSKDLNFKLRFGYIIDILLLLAMVTILISGIFISKVLFTWISSPGGNWKVLHYFVSALSLILVGIHIGLHWRFVMGMLKKYVKLPALVARIASIVLVIAILLFGSYNIYSSNFRMWLTAPFTSNHMKGGQRPINSDSQPGGLNPGTNVAPEQNSDSSDGNIAPSQNGKASNDSTADNSSQKPNKNNQATDSIQQDQQNQDQKQEGTRPSKPNGVKAFNKGNKPSGDRFPQDRKEIPQDSKGFPGKGVHGEQGGDSNVLSVILSFTSIMGVFATITYYCEKFLRKRKSSKAIIQD